MQIFTIDCTDIATEADFWRAYLDVTKPDSAHHFGRNLDALNDALTGGGPGYPGACELHLTNSAALAPLRDGAFLRALRDIAADCRDVPLRLR